MNCFNKAVIFGIKVLIAASVLYATANGIATPKQTGAPCINGPTVFGVRPGSPFLYSIPASGKRPMHFSIETLPNGLQVNAETGRITGVLSEKGTYTIKLSASNDLGVSSKVFRIIVSDEISLTPPMGWNSWTCWATSVDQDKVLRAARAMVATGLAEHGWTFVNIDDSWQGHRGGIYNAIQANKKFPDMGGLCTEIHGMGLKVGIYSTPWITSYAKYCGGSSDNTNGRWDQSMAIENYWRCGNESFALKDTKQWAAWGIDYLKYDWSPNDVRHGQEMGDALRTSGRNIIYSLSNSADFSHAGDWARLANSWRTTGDIWDHWEENSAVWQYGVSEIGFSQDRWAPFSGAGHWNDPDMLVLGLVGWGPTLRSTSLTANEQYTHFSLWCMLSAPLLLGCNMERLDEFTLSLLTNDEVIALDQDSLGKQAMRVATIGPVDIYTKALEDGSAAIGFFNRGQITATPHFNKLSRIGFEGIQHVRDLWRHIDLPDVDGSIDVSVSSHGVVLLRLRPAKVEPHPAGP